MPTERARAKALVARLKKQPETSDEVFTAFAELDALPPDVVRAELEPWTGPAPSLPTPPRLLTLAITKDADVLDLGPVAEQQLRLAGKSWDGEDKEPEERLDGELEGSFAGTLEHHVLGDEDRTPRFDVLRYHGDAGVVFRAGTLERVGFITDRHVETKDAATRRAIEDALFGDARENAPAPAKKRTSTAKKKTAAAPKKKKSAAASKKKSKAG